MESLKERFLRYVAIDTQSVEDSSEQPSSKKQLDLLNLLKRELESMGVQAEVDRYGYLMARIPSNIESQTSAVGFIAHVDT